jgi:hypothetical protein
MIRPRTLAAAAFAVAAVLAAAPAASAETATYGANSSANPFYIWTVPARTCSATFDLYGAEGSGGVGGARVTTTLAVTPGSQYYVFVGSWGLLGRGGYNGGGNPSGDGIGGGGATDVRTGPGLSQRILVAGGGGGNSGGGYAKGGAGGLVGAAGADGNPAEPEAGKGGGGGTALAGGAGGLGYASGSPGTLGQGGAGGAQTPSFPFPNVNNGGGGGGGYYGGGGGGAAEAGEPYPGGGGGGGSSLAAGGTVTSTTGGQGKAVITYTPSATCGATGGGPGGGPNGGGGSTETGPGDADRTKPTLRGLRLSRHTFVAARSGPSIGPETKASTAQPKVSFDLSETGTVRFVVERKTRGRTLDGRCVTSSRSPHGRRCTRWQAVSGSFSFAASAGPNAFVFRGRIGGRTLGRGDYRLSGRATDNARNTSAVARAGFHIVAPH